MCRHVIFPKVLGKSPIVRTAVPSNLPSASRVALKIRFLDRASTTRSQTLSAAIASAAEIHGVASRLLERTPAGTRPARGVGISLGRLERAGEGDAQLDLFPR